MTLFVLAVLTAIGLGGAAIDFAIGHRRVRLLKDVAPASIGPPVSIIAAARNEARGIEAAAASLLSVDYPDLEVILVDDRSTDGTGAILDRLAQAHRHLIVIHVSELPDGWLGKNHALSVGAARASGELLLFTDADVVFETTAVRRAVAVLEGDRLDHLAAIPDIRVPGVALNAFVAAFGVFFTLYSRPWKARDPRSRSHIGIGAFNLVRARVYRAVGTHQAIAMRPDDDIKLGKLVKKHGFRQDVVHARDEIIVEWYSSLGAMIDGLMKNAFAGVNYSVWGVIGSTAALVLMYVWPVIALFATHGATRAVNALSVALTLLIFSISVRHSGGRLVYALAFPAAALLFAYVIWRSALRAVIRGSVAWRGTEYPLERLRANRV